MGVSDEPESGRPPTGEYRGALWFSPGSLEWRPSARTQRRGVGPIRWNVVDRIQAEARPIWGSIPLMHLRVYDVSYVHPICDLWLSVKPARLEDLLAVTLAVGRPPSD